MPGLEHGSFGLPDYIREDLASQEFIRVPNPVPGGTIARDIPGSAWELYLSILFALTTDANPANRFIRLTLTDGEGNGVATLTAVQTQPAGTVFNYIFSTAVSAAYAVNAANQVMPGLPIVAPAGFRLRVTCDLIQAGDQFSNIAFVIIAFPTGPFVEEAGAIGPLAASTLGLISVPTSPSSDISGGVDFDFSPLPGLAVAPAPVAPPSTSTTVAPTSTPIAPPPKTTTTTTTTPTAPAPVAPAPVLTPVGPDTITYSRSGPTIVPEPTYEAPAPPPPPPSEPAPAPAPAPTPVPPGTIVYPRGTPGME